MNFEINADGCNFEETSSIQLDDEYFGEGATFVEESMLVYQLTWRENEVLVWEVTEVENDDGEIHHELSEYDTLDWPANNVLSEGWGIAHWSGRTADDVVIFATDGSDQLSLISAANWTTVHTINVVDHDGEPVHYLNELELIDDHPEPDLTHHLARYIFANVWQEKVIHMISLESGSVVAEWTLDDLYTQQEDYLTDNGLDADSYDWGDNVLNGIAYLRDRDTFFITGKNWDLLFEVELNYR